MNITFLIGNGFDLACGLKTSYPDFIEQYLLLPSASKNIESFKQLVKKDITLWSDAETAFGEYTQHFSLSELSAYRECLDDFIREMAKHLGMQEWLAKNIKLSNEMLESFGEGIYKFNLLLNENSRKKIDHLVYDSGDDIRNFNFLIFNYTSVFEHFVENLAPQSKLLTSTWRSNGTKISNRVNNITYVHGKLNTSTLIFGVDNQEQVMNKELLSNSRFKRSIIKPDANTHLRNDSVAQCLECIDDSMIICIYGMSIGYTDSFWWTFIVKWLRENSDHHLIQYAWSSTCIRHSAGSYSDSLDDCRESLYQRLLLSEDDANALKNQIHIEVNVDLFGVNETFYPLVRSSI